MARTTTDSSSDRIEVTSNASIENIFPFFWIGWVRLRTAPADARIMYSKASGGGTGFQRQMVVNTTRTIQIDVNTNAGAAIAVSTVGDPYRLVVDEWTVVAGAMSGSPITPQLFIGRFASPIVECTYNLQTTRTGTIRTDVGAPFRMANGWGSMAWSPHMDFGPYAFFNRIPTLNEMRSWAHRPRKMSGVILFHRPGFGDAGGTAADFSGTGNTGTLTGTSTAAGPPIGYRGLTGIG